MQAITDYDDPSDPGPAELAGPGQPETEAEAETAPAAVDSPELNPAQVRINDALRGAGSPRPTFARDLDVQLRTRLEHDLDDVAASLADPLWVGKFALSAVHGCEARYLHLKGQPFVMSAAVAAGTVTHKAIQLGRFRDGATPAELVEDAFERIEDGGDRTGDWLRLASAADRAEVRSISVERVTQFEVCFPPIRRTWRCVAEMPVRAELCGGRVILSGRIDLAFGRPDGSVAGRAFVDLKTGGRHPAHGDDLRFYALIEALRLGVPPFRVGSLYLDAASLVAEDVTVDLLVAAAARTADGVRRLVALSAGDQPEYRPGPACRWCPLRGSCTAGRSFLGSVDDPDFDPDGE